MIYDIAIIGAGPCGLTAAIYALRAGKKTVVFEKAGIGGQIAYSQRIENYPAIPSISGMEFADNLYEQAVSFGADIKLCDAMKIINGDIKKIETDSGTFEARSVIIASGAENRRLGIEGADELPGVSYCAVCDGAFHKGEDVAVCGGGSTALQSALYLADICNKVYIVHRRNEFRGEALLASKIEEKSNIIKVLESRVTALSGSDFLTGITVTDKEGNNTDIAVTALFVNYGKVPSSDIAKDILPLSEDGYIIASEDCRTPVSGIYAAGDVRVKAVRQLTTAVSDGTNAVSSAISDMD